MRRVGVVSLLAFLASCVSYLDIEKTKPVFEASFAGSHRAVARCVQTALDGKPVNDPLNENRIIIFNSEKAYEWQGLTHYSISFEKTGENTGTVQFRKLPDGPKLGTSATKAFLDPVKRCAKV